MDIDKKYEDLIVQVSCKYNAGSGCLFQPASDRLTYVITAKHCLQGKDGNIVEFCKDDIIVKRYKAKAEDQALIVVDYKMHEDLDIAVILVSLVGDIPIIGIEVPERHRMVSIFGYPKLLSGGDVSDNRQNIECKITRNIDNKEFEIVPERPLINYNNDIPALIEGFSGSGVFYEAYGYIYLIGVFTRLKSPSGEYETLCAINIDVLNKLLIEKDLPEAVPACLCSFNQYYTEAFSRYDENIAVFLSEKSKEITELNPKIIASILKEKLFLPYGKSSNVNNELWNGWLLLLTYLYLDKDENLNRENFLFRIKSGSNQNIKFYYSEELNTLEQVIRHLFVDIYDDIKQRDFIIINGPRPPYASLLDTNKINKIVSRIDLPILNKNKVLIDGSPCIKDISCMHLDNFSSEISKIEEPDYRILASKIKKCIKEVFENAV